MNGGGDDSEWKFANWKTESKLWDDMEASQGYWTTKGPETTKKTICAFRKLLFPKYVHLDRDMEPKLNVVVSTQYGKFIQPPKHWALFDPITGDFEAGDW